MIVLVVVVVGMWYLNTSIHYNTLLWQCKASSRNACLDIGLNKPVFFWFYYSLFLRCDVLKGCVL